MPNDTTPGTQTWEDKKRVIEAALAQLKSAADALAAAPPRPADAASAVRDVRVALAKVIEMPPGTFPSAGDTTHSGH